MASAATNLVSAEPSFNKPGKNEAHHVSTKSIMLKLAWPHFVFVAFVDSHAHALSPSEISAMRDDSDVETYAIVGMSVKSAIALSTVKIEIVPPGAQRVIGLLSYECRRSVVIWH